MGGGTHTLVGVASKLGVMARSVHVHGRVLVTLCGLGHVVRVAQLAVGAVVGDCRTQVWLRCSLEAADDILGVGADALGADAEHVNTNGKHGEHVRRRAHGGDEGKHEDQIWRAVQVLLRASEATGEDAKRAEEEVAGARDYEREEYEGESVARVGLHRHRGRLPGAEPVRGFWMEVAADERAELQT